MGNFIDATQNDFKKMTPTFQTLKTNDVSDTLESDLKRLLDFLNWHQSASPDYLHIVFAEDSRQERFYLTVVPPRSPACDDFSRNETR